MAIESNSQGTRMNTEDLSWFEQNPYFKYVPEGARCNLYAKKKQVLVAAGQRIIVQGEEGHELYIIRHGQCAVSIERGGVPHLVGRIGPGQIVGEMAILTGDPRIAHVDAETDMELWAISRNSFFRTCAQFPQLRQILTWIVTDRLSSALLRSDRTVGKYVVEKIIGEGGSSFIYKGYHSTLDLPVAIKMLKHDVAMDPLFYKQFLKEGKTIAQLNHPNIVKVYDVEELYRTFFIIMEYIDGDPLSHVLSREKRPAFEEMVDILLQTCAGVLHAHENGILHGDIKPGNILIEKENRVRLVDFGFARAPGTKEECAVGTAHFISPEQILRGEADEKSDIYSLGITAYRIFTGCDACPCSNPEEILDWHVTHDIKDPSCIAPNLPKELQAFITKATRKDPKERYSSIRQILHDLEPLAENLGLGGRRRAEEMNMMGFFVFYRKENQSMIHRLFRDFGRELEKMGARLRGTDFKNVERLGPQKD
jgi:eukaryotic-like serine/threonine-protein kinase